jgi:DNA processing protein
MIGRLSSDAQAIALACSGLGRRDGGAKPLTPSEWHRLSLSMRRADPQLRPGHLLAMSAEDMRDRLDLPDEAINRLVALLSRGGQLAFEVEHLSRRGIWLLTRADDDYPKLLKDRLRATSPPVLYCSGRRGLVATDALAIVGSRNVDDAGIAYSRALAERCVKQGLAVVSGAARGVDWTAMTAALEAGGTAIGVLADPLERMIKRHELRRALADDQLLLLSPFQPSARWHAGNAMSRNRLIYGLARAAVVVASAEGSGGTWNGAIENLEHRWVPVFVRDDATAGARGLIAHGAIALPESSAPDDLRDLFVPAQTSLLDVAADEPSPERTVAEPTVEASSAMLLDDSVLARDEIVPHSTMPADVFFGMVWNALSGYLVEPRRPEDVAKTFDVAVPQAKAWLARAVDEGRAEKMTRPVRYVAVAGRQLHDNGS